jgi:hypothetical protein
MLLTAKEHLLTDASAKDPELSKSSEMYPFGQ